MILEYRINSLYYKISKVFFQQIVNECKKSFYYKNFSNEFSFNPSIRKNEKMWTQITLASFTEHLYERNVEIVY